MESANPIAEVRDVQRATVQCDGLGLLQLRFRAQTVVAGRPGLPGTENGRDDAGDRINAPDSVMV